MPGSQVSKEQSDLNDSFNSNNGLPVPSNVGGDAAMQNSAPAAVKDVPLISRVSASKVVGLPNLIYSIVQGGTKYEGNNSTEGWLAFQHNIIDGVREVTSKGDHSSLMKEEALEKVLRAQCG